jgi:hypothetical protein
MNLPVLVINKDYEKVTIQMPAHYEVCSRCGGHGAHSNPSIDSNGLSQEMIDDDPDFREEYMNGAYDVKCTECKGLRVVPVVDVSQCTYAQKRALVRKRQDEIFDSQFKAYARAEQRAMGIY